MIPTVSDLTERMTVRLKWNAGRNVHTDRRKIDNILIGASWQRSTGPWRWVHIHLGLWVLSISIPTPRSAEGGK